jgi:LPS-assembly protein
MPIPANTTFYSLLASAVLLAAALPVKADSSGPWLCTPDSKNQWHCSRQATTNSVASAGQRLINSNDSARWDWVRRADLADPSRCKTGCEGAYTEPLADWPNAGDKPQYSPILAESGSYTTVDNVASFSGGVTISRGHQRIIADRASLDRNSNQTSVAGHIEIREPGLLIRASSAQFDNSDGTGQFEGSEFVLHRSALRGAAESLQRPSADTLIIEQGMITQCSPDNETWRFEASTIALDQDSGVGTARGATLIIKDVPVLYTPYISFPIDERRTTGFLWPTFGSSGDSGVDITTPYYINIAANTDATLAPRLIGDRGLMLEAELRHLNRFGHWLLGGAKISDNLYEQFSDDAEGLSPRALRDLPPQKNRWLAHIKQNGSIGAIETRIDYSKVSDDEYFRDLSVNSLEVKRTSHLNQMLALDYKQRDWQANLVVQQRQTLDEDLNNQYQLMPQLSLERNSHSEAFALEWLAQTQISNFQHDDAIDKGGEFVTGQRIYAESGLRYPLRWAGGFIVPTAKIRHLNYNLDANVAGADTSINTTIAAATLDMGLFFERPSSFGDGNFLQTLEPRLYYSYSGYKDQSEQPDFDSKELTFSYSHLFRDSRFSGHDRLDDANQLSLGVTSRFIDTDTGREVLSASIGQIFFFEDRRVALNVTKDWATRDSSYMATALQYQPHERVWLNNHLLWDSEQNTLQEAGASFHYRSTTNSLYNLNYRYRRDGDRNLLTGQQNLEQLEASVLYAVNEHWSVYSRVKYDITEEQGIDSMLGLQYESCCWKLSLLYQEGFEDEFVNEPAGTLLVENDYAFIIEFQLKGLGGISGKTNNILKESILGYEDLD